MISNGRVCEEGCIRMTESKLSMSGGRFSRSSFIGTMTEAHGRGASVMKSRPARYQRSKKSLRLHSIEGLEDGQSRRDTAVQKRNCKVASEGLHDRIPGISAARFAICSFIYSPSLQHPVHNSGLTSLAYERTATTCSACSSHSLQLPTKTSFNLDPQQWCLAQLQLKQAVSFYEEPARRMLENGTVRKSMFEERLNVPQTRSEIP